MGLDLKLFSISSKVDFVLDKAKSNLLYAIDFDKILETETLKLHLKMIQENPDGTPESILKELIQDSIIVLDSYPNRSKENYTFYSKTRGYSTINYLLEKYLIDKRKRETSELFYSGIKIENDSQFVRFEYIREKEVSEICDLLELIDFDDLLKYYDLEKMQAIVYKLMCPDMFVFLKEEFSELKKFYKESKKLNAFVVIKIS